MLAIRNLNKSFGSLHVLKDINLDLNKGEVMAIIGPSGTGKSTLLRCINHLEAPQSGTITIKDFHTDYGKIKKGEIRELRKHSSMVFQNYNLFKNKTTIQNVMEPLVVVQKMNKDEAEKIAEELLRKVGMLDKRDQYPSRLSGGQQQRVGIARAMSVSPDIILFDEPTSALDPELVGEVLTVIKDLSDQHCTMILVTHEMKFAEGAADQVVFMADGSIVEQGPPEQVLRDPKMERTRQFLKMAERQ